MAGASVEAVFGIWQIRRVIPPLAIDVFVICFGLIIGSFLNVCIVRVPERKSIVLPSSACPKCGAKIRPYDNIPILSWILLGGRCRDCKTPISPMYPVVELITAVVFWGCYRAFGLTLDALKWAIFSAVLIVLVFTDLRERILPDVVNFTGLGLGLALSLVTRSSDGTAEWLARHAFDLSLPMPVLSLFDAILGAALGSGLLWAVAAVYFRLRGREGMGMGDIKMMMMVGAFLGVKRTLLTIFAGSLLGSVLGLAFIASRHKDSTYELPFGSFLGTAALLAAFFGTPVVNWYQSLMMGH